MDGHLTDQGRLWTPERQQLPAHLVAQVVQAVRRVGLPLAWENDNDVGVFLTRADGQLDAPGPADHVAFVWHLPDSLLDAADAEESPAGGPAGRLVAATDKAMDAALAAILTAAGLTLAPEPGSGNLAVWDTTAGTPPAPGT